MEDKRKEIIIKRKKSDSIKYAVFMFLLAALFSAFALNYFIEIPFITSSAPLIAVIVSLIFIPVFIFCGIIYCKQAANENPILIINDEGLYQDINPNFSHLIKWEDIREVKLRADFSNALWIDVFLIETEKHIVNERLKYKIQSDRKKLNNLNMTLTAIYFKKELDSVVHLMLYYIDNDVKNR